MTTVIATLVMRAMSYESPPSLPARAYSVLCPPHPTPPQTITRTNGLAGAYRHALVFKLAGGCRGRIAGGRWVQMEPLSAIGLYSKLYRQ